MTAAKTWRGIELHTVGHSTRTLEELVAILRAFDVSVLADIRTIPRSRHNPQFNGDALRSALRSRRIRYVHIPELGGLRRTRQDSPNTAWRNASFRGFADYMLTEDFETGLAKLRELTAARRVALMCAEAVPWRCHRSLVADALTVRGAHVEHITSVRRSARHRMTAFAVVKRSRVTYPDETGEALRGGTGSPAARRCLPGDVTGVLPDGRRRLTLRDTRPRALRPGRARAHTARPRSHEGGGTP